MATNIEQEWIAVQDDEIVFEAPTRGKLLEKLWLRDEDSDDYKLCAVPKPHDSFWI